MGAAQFRSAEDSQNADEAIIRQLENDSHNTAESNRASLEKASEVASKELDFHTAQTKDARRTAAEAAAACGLGSAALGVLTKRNKGQKSKKDEAQER